MRHDTRKIHDENPLITRGLYGGGGGGGGGGDGPGTSGDTDAIGAIGMGGDLGATLADMGNTGVSGSGMSPGTMASIANFGAGLFGMGIPSIGGVIGPGAAIAATAALGNAINGVTGFGGGTPGTGTGDPGSASSPGGGMASYIGNYDQFGNFVPNMANAYMGGGYWLQPQSAQEAQDWANNGFDAAAYLRANPDVANDPYYSTRPWEHYYTHGAREGRSPGGAAPAPAPAAAPAPAPAAAPAGPAPVNPNVPDDIRRAQLELVQQQRDIATQMQQRQQALQDQLMAAQGYEPDGAGGYRLNATAQAAADQQNAIAAQLRQRTLDALAGNLPVDPALERGLGEQRRTLEATLRGNLGSGFETSTPGIEALANFDKRAEELRTQARHDQLTTAEGLRLAGQQVSGTASTQNLANVLGITNAGSVPAGLLSSAAGGLSPIGSNLLGYASLDNAYRIAQLTGQNSQSELAQRLAAQDNAGYGALVGQLGSAFLRSDYAGNVLNNLGSGVGNLLSNVGSGLGSLWDSIGGWFG